MSKVLKETKGGLVNSILTLGLQINNLINILLVTEEIMYVN